MRLDDFSNFVPSNWLKGPHRQTIVAAFLFGKQRLHNAVQHHVLLDDGDQIVLHDNCPQSWQPGDRVALMIHGLAGCHASPFMVRIAAKLNDRSIRTFRIDLRGAGAGEKLARRPYHAGLTSDLAEAIRTIEKLCPNSALTLLGFSLGGCLSLKLAGESGSNIPGNLDSILAVNPPTDLKLCCNQLPRFYDRHFLNLLLKRLKKRKKLVPEMILPPFPRKPRRLYELDDWYTAPASGFSSAEQYYREASCNQFLSSIKLPTLIITSQDDPVVPFQTFKNLPLSDSTTAIITNHGGHLGFISQGNSDPDSLWLDWRAIDWVEHQQRQPTGTKKQQQSDSILS